MIDLKTANATRSFGPVDLIRAVVVLPILAIIAAIYWFALPSIQALILPDVPGGIAGPWLVRPIMAFHFGAVAILTAVTFPVILGPLRKRWEREDAELGSRFHPMNRRPAKRIGMMVNGCLLLLVYAAGLVFYLFSWTEIRPDGIEERLPWTTILHSFEDIAFMEMIPDGERSESLIQNGPWFSIRFKTGRSVTLSHDNEGSTGEELNAMATFIADRAGADWERRKDSVPR